METIRLPNRQQFAFLIAILSIACSLAAGCRSVGSITGTGERPGFNTAGSIEAGNLTRIEDLRRVELADGELLEVVATTTIVADIVKNVGGETIRLVTLMDAGVDPHSYQVTARDLAAIADAHVVFVNGFGLEESLLDTLAQASENVPIVSLAEGIKPRLVAADAPGSGDASQTAAETGHEEPATGADPHVWLDPTNVRIWVDNAARSLGRLASAHTAVYQQNASRYQDELESLDSWIQDEVAQIPEGSRTLVTDHDELGYFAARYGFRIVGAVIPAYSPAAEPSAQELANLQEAIRALDVKAVFVGSTVNPVLAERIAEDSGIELRVLYTGSLSGPDGPAETYMALMRYNVQTLVESLR